MGVCIRLVLGSIAASAAGKQGRPGALPAPMPPSSSAASPTRPAVGNDGLAEDRSLARVGNESTGENEHL